VEKVILKAIKRETFGKGACKHLRKEGFIPGVIYKDGKEGINTQISNKDLWHALSTDAGENAIITMDISGGEKDIKKTVIVKEIQRDPISDDFLHVDFCEISLKEKLKVKVPVVVKGEAVGVKEDEGVLTQVAWELEVECLPTEIPEHLDVQVDEMRIGDAIHVKDVEAPMDVLILDDPEMVVVTVNPPHIEEEVVEEEVLGEEGEEEPEIIKKGKKEEEEGGEAPPAEGGEKRPAKDDG